MVYVDPLAEWAGPYQGEQAAQAAAVGARNGDRWCHLFTDGDEEELHRFAATIGMKRRWFQGDRDGGHYDLTPGKRRLAVANGAKEVEQHEAVMIWRAQRAKLAAAAAQRPPVLRF